MAVASSGLRFSALRGPIEVVAHRMKRASRFRGYRNLYGAQKEEENSSGSPRNHDGPFPRDQYSRRRKASNTFKRMRVVPL